MILDFKAELKKHKNFENARTNLKWIISKKSETEIQNFIETIKLLLGQIRIEGLKK